MRYLRYVMQGVLVSLCVLSLAIASHAQAVSNASTINGTVADPSGAVVVGAVVEIQNPVSGFTRSTTTDSMGNFTIANVPFNPYHMTVTSVGFSPYAQDVDVRSTVPVQLKITLALKGATQTVTVEAAGDLIETDSTAHTDLDRSSFQELPLENQSSSLSSLITLSAPGVVADSNGLFHGLGDHAENSFSIDGQPITDQQSKVFSNQLPVDAVQSMEVIEGAPPAEYGDKTSLIAVVTTRSGLGVHTPTGSVTASYGSFGSSTIDGNLAYGTDKWGNFIALSGLNSGRFLDTPEFDVIHDKGNEENIFDRVDLKPSHADSVSLNFQYTRSWFQTPNSFDAEDATAWNGLVVANGGLGPNGLPVGSEDQRSKIRTINVAPAWTRIINPETVFTFGGFVRQDQFNYYPSANPFADLQPITLQSTTVGQNRTLTNAGVRADVAYVKGIHSAKAGVVYEHWFLTEDDTFGIVDPTFNSACLNADGSPNTNPAITDPSLCAGPLSPNPGFIPLLGCYDLTRTAQLPASDDCPNSASTSYLFHGHTDVKELSLYAEDTITKGPWSFDIGVRGDVYNGITSKNQIEPRAGVAYNIKKTSTVLRASYAHTLETPFNENLILSSQGCNNPVVNDIMATIQGYPCTTSPIQPGIRNEYHLGLQQAFGRYFVLDGEYIWKFTRNAYDFSVFANSPITFPIDWYKSKIPGYAIRGTVPNIHGLSAYIVMAHVAARFFTPQVSGIGVTPVSTGTSSVFRIDHDENFEETTHLQYQPRKNLPWFGFNWRYDSGLVAGPVPCAGGNCPNGPLGTDSVVDFSGLTPDQQFEAGLFCGTTHATPPGPGNPTGTPISPTGLCPASQYGSTLIKIPAPGTENDDRNPQRIAPRNLFDISVGDDNLFHQEKHQWSLRFTVINITNKYALYNFLSTFSGTHYVTPRTETIELGYHF